jgi:hypothetical protein
VSLLIGSHSRDKDALVQESRHRVSRPRSKETAAGVDVRPSGVVPTCSKTSRQRRTVGSGA